MGVADLHPDALSRPAAAPELTVRPAATVLLQLLLVLLVSVIVGVMAYQAPPSGRVRVGWLGDRLFLAATSGLGADALARGDLYADDLTPDSPTLRSRWARQHALITLPNLGAGAPLQLRLVAQGWPSDVLDAPVAQPTVTVRANGVELGSFTPAPEWATYSFALPARPSGADLRIELDATHSFTDTASFGADPRPKALRLAELSVQADTADLSAVYPPASRAVALLGACALLLYLLLTRLVRGPLVVYGLTIVGVGLAGVGLAYSRIWMGAALWVALVGLGVLLLLAWQRQILGLARALVRRFTQGRALSYGLVAAALVLLGYALAQLFAWFGSFGEPLFWQIFPDSLLYGLLGAGLLALVLALGRDGLPRLADGIVGLIGSRRGALTLLVGFGCLWIGYEAWVVAQLPYAGHADYSDNAVVARNLVAGRGWVVDYVTQFYRLNDGLTRPQETWPLLQPVWIAPFFMLFGASSWAAKLPNLIFNVILLVLVYRIGAQVWDRRVGLTAALFLLTNYLFFRLTIYVTNDLAFVVFSLGALYALYRATDERPTTDDGADGTRWTVDGGRTTDDGGRMTVDGERPPAIGYRLSAIGYLTLSGLLTGLMMLQKPSGAMIALGMGLWLIAQRTPSSWAGLRLLLAPRNLWRTLAPIAAWTLLALLVLSPYLARNMALFGRPVYSTESYDAWVLGYRGPGSEPWADIYDVFAPELGGPGLPDRSWILRWGFDKTLDKFGRQVDALRNYVMPVWRGLPEGPAQLFGDNERKNIASDLGAWLALIGVIGALRYRRRLLGLLAAAYAPYVLFMLTYWRTDEERYWVLLLPWLALLAAWTIWAGYDKLAAISDRRWAPLGLVLVVAAVAGVVSFSRPDIAKKVRVEPGPELWQPDLTAYAWLDANLPPDAAVMTRIPWQLNWHTERPALMIPNTSDRALLLEIARHYGVEYLALENQQRVKGDAGQLLAPLLDHNNQVGAVIDGFELIYASPTPDFRAFIYRLPKP
jgi:4-amino-4-deoxy-L-arabinose transferase-like glycosyltransferase